MLFMPRYAKKLCPRNGQEPRLTPGTPVHAVSEYSVLLWIAKELQHIHSTPGTLYEYSKQWHNYTHTQVTLLQGGGGGGCMVTSLPISRPYCCCHMYITACSLSAVPPIYVGSTTTRRCCRDFKQQKGSTSFVSSSFVLLVVAATIYHLDF